MEIIWLSLFLLFAGVNWIAAARQKLSWEYVAKPAAAAALLLLAASGPLPSFWLIAALVFCLLGDVYLMLPGNYFIAGLTAFLLAQLAYAADFQAGLVERAVWTTAVFVVALPVSLRVIGAIKETAVKAAVVLYMVTISLMAGSAIASGSLIGAAGALLFVASDSMIAWDMFVRRIPRGHLWVMVTYHLAQLGLVLALR